MGASIFDQYADPGDVYENTRAGGSRTRYFPDCEAEYTLAVVELRSGVGQNKKSTKNMGRPYAAGKFRVVRVHWANPTPDGVPSRIREGGFLDWHTWLPRSPDRKDWSLEDEYNYAEAQELVGGLVHVVPGAITRQILGEAFSDDGAKMIGRQIGCTVGSSPGDNVTFFNPEFWPCDDAGGRLASVRDPRA